MVRVHHSALLAVVALVAIADVDAFDADNYECDLSPQTRHQIAAWVRGEGSLTKLDLSCAIVAVAGGVGEVVGSVTGQVVGARKGRSWLGPLFSNVLQAAGLSEGWADAIGGSVGSVTGQVVGGGLGRTIGKEAGKATARSLILVGSLFGSLPAPGDVNGRGKAIAECEALFGYSRNNAPTTFRDLKLAWRRLAMSSHPDKPGGSQEKMLKVNFCREALKVHYRLRDPKDRGNAQNAEL